MNLINQKGIDLILFSDFQKKKKKGGVIVYAIRYVLSTRYFFSHHFT